MVVGERIYLGPGVSLYLRGEVWWTELYVKGKRKRASLNIQARERGRANGTGFRERSAAHLPRIA
jgi:hypothetical protein